MNPLLLPTSLTWIRCALRGRINLTQPRIQRVRSTGSTPFLHEQLKLDLSEAKTLITHGRTQAARFLGYEVTVIHNDQKRNRHGHRSVNGQIGLKVPADVVLAKCAPYMRNGKAIHRGERINESVHDIVARFQSEYRGLVEYYRMAYNLHQLGRLKWVMQDSLAKTLSAKLNISVGRVYRRFRAIIRTPVGPRTVLRVTVGRDGRRRPLV